jgi:hypothetical protein
LRFNAKIAIASLVIRFPLGKIRVRHNFLDGFAIGASGVCLAHCLILPVFLVMMPGGTAWLGLHGLFHVVFLGIAIPTSLLALLSGKRRHGLTGPLMAGGMGLIGLLLGVAFEEVGNMGTAFTVLGSLVLIAAHVTNWRLLVRLEQ